MVRTHSSRSRRFDYNTASRQTHWNLWEREDGQGLLELGFYRGLYNVFERTLEKYTSVWIEGCASGGRMIDVRLHPEHFSLILIFACSRSK